MFPKLKKNPNLVSLNMESYAEYIWCSISLLKNVSTIKFEKFHEIWDFDDTVA